MDNGAIEYGDWLIWNAPSPLAVRNMDWHFAHKDFTSEHAGDYRSGSEATEEECRRSIAFIEDMDAQDATPEGQAKLEASAARLTEKAMETMAAIDMARALHQILSVPGIGNLPGFATGVHLQAARTALDAYARYHPGIIGPADKATAA